MKKYIFISTLLLVCTITNHLQAQEFSVGVGAGSGKSYIVEDIEDNRLQFGLPVSIYVEGQYRPAQTNWALKLRMQHINSTLKSTDSKIDGYVSTWGYYLLAESQKKWHKNSYCGLHSGLGKTNEFYSYQYDTFSPNEKTFLSYAIGTSIAYKLSDWIQVRIEPTLYFFDPINAMRGLINGKKLVSAGEDINIVLQAGLVYQIH
jgi:hypothetical protein